jgi:hypothetical protein
MIVAVLVSLFVTGVSVLVSEFVVDELLSTKLTTALELKSVSIPQYFANSVFAVAAVANDQELG